ncbi:MAG: hypothetical protein ACLTZT_19660 [Butyricimonas faecalis]
MMGYFGRFGIIQVEAGKLTNIDMLIRPCVEKWRFWEWSRRCYPLSRRADKTGGNPFAEKGTAIALMRRIRTDKSFVAGYERDER